MLKRSTEYYQSLLREFIKLPTEVEWIEFKVNNKDPERIAKYISGIFSLDEKEKYKVSRIIKDTIEAKLIKPVDPDTAPRYMRYVPFWA